METNRVKNQIMRYLFYVLLLSACHPYKNSPLRQDTKINPCVFYKNLDATNDFQFHGSHLTETLNQRDFLYTLKKLDSISESKIDTNNVMNYSFEYLKNKMPPLPFRKYYATDSVSLLALFNSKYQYNLTLNIIYVTPKYSNAKLIEILESEKETYYYLFVMRKQKVLSIIPLHHSSNNYATPTFLYTENLFQKQKTIKRESWSHAKYEYTDSCKYTIDKNGNISFVAD